MELVLHRAGSPEKGGGWEAALWLLGFVSSGPGLALLGWVAGFAAGDSVYTIAQPAIILGDESLSLYVDSVCKQQAMQKWVPGLELSALR